MPGRFGAALASSPSTASTRLPERCCEGTFGSWVAQRTDPAPSPPQGGEIIIRLAPGLVAGGRSTWAHRVPAGWPDGDLHTGKWLGGHLCPQAGPARPHLGAPCGAAPLPGRLQSVPYIRLSFLPVCPTCRRWRGSRRLAQSPSAQTKAATEGIRLQDWITPGPPVIPTL